MAKEAIQKIEPAGALALPDFVDRNDRSGADNITGDDIRLPRLALAQALSPEVQESDPKYIEGLRPGHMFSNLLQTNFGRGPLEVVVVRRELPRAIEFWPRDSKEGKGIKDRDVPYYGKSDPRTDARCKFGADGEKPTATVFHEFVAFHAETREPFLLSFKSTSTPAATSLNTFLSLRGGPAYATTFKLVSVEQRNDHGPFNVFRVQPGKAVDRETYEYAKGMYESLKGRKVSVEDLDDVPAVPVPDTDDSVPF